MVLEGLRWCDSGWGGCRCQAWHHRRRVRPPGASEGPVVAEASQCGQVTAAAAGAERVGVRPRPPCLRLPALPVCTRGQPGEESGKDEGVEGRRGVQSQEVQLSPAGAEAGGRSGPSAGEEVASTATEGLGGLWGGTLGWLRAAFCPKGRSRRVMPSEQVRSPTHVRWRPRARCAVKGQTWEVAEQTEVNGKWKVGAFTRARQTEGELVWGGSFV